MKPYFETENGVLYHGDCLTIMPQLEKVDLVLTDIPYGEVNRDSNGLRNLNKGKADIETFTLSELLPMLNSKIKGSSYMFCGTEQVSAIRNYFVKAGLSTRLGVWEKTNPSPMNGKHLWLSGVECFVFARRKGAVFNLNCKNPVIRNPVARNQMHPTQKPTGVFQELVLASTNKNQTCLDVCFGSGTLGVVCEQNNRKWVGIEKEEKYCEIAAKRIEQSTAQLNLPGF